MIRCALKSPIKAIDHISFKYSKSLIKGKIKKAFTPSEKKCQYFFQCPFNNLPDNLKG